MGQKTHVMGSLFKIKKFFCSESRVDSRFALQEDFSVRVRGWPGLILSTQATLKEISTP